MNPNFNSEEMALKTGIQMMFKLILENKSLHRSTKAILAYKFPNVNYVIAESCDFLHQLSFFFSTVGTYFAVLKGSRIYLHNFYTNFKYGK